MSGLLVKIYGYDPQDSNETHCQMTYIEDTKTHYHEISYMCSVHEYMYEYVVYNVHTEQSISTI